MMIERSCREDWRMPIEVTELEISRLRALI